MIYLDYNSTTPVHPEVLSAMMPFFSEHYGNASNTSHTLGWNASFAIKKARDQVAALLGVLPHEVFFTSGATESNNWAIRGVTDSILKDAPKEKIHILTSNTEHSSIYRLMQHLATDPRFEIQFLECDSVGRIRVADVLNNIKSNTKLVSLIWVNNEIGTINPIMDIAHVCRQKQVLFHCDGTQAVGKIEMDLSDKGPDLLSLSSHKIYGPKGAGALFVRSRNPSVGISPLFYGGGQESGLRSGTMNTPGIVGLGKACELMAPNISKNWDHQLVLKKAFLSSLKEAFPSLTQNGCPDLSSAHVLNVTFPEGSQTKLMNLSGRLAASAGAACGTAKTSYSHVLKAIGVSADQAERTLRFSLGKSTRPEDIHQAIEILKQVLA